MKIDTPHICYKFRKPFRSVLGFLGNPFSWNTILGSEHAYGGFQKAMEALLNHPFLIGFSEGFPLKKTIQRAWVPPWLWNTLLKWMIWGYPPFLWKTPMKTSFSNQPAAPRHPGTVEHVRHVRCAPVGEMKSCWKHKVMKHEWKPASEIWSYEKYDPQLDLSMKTSDWTMLNLRKGEDFIKKKQWVFLHTQTQKNTDYPGIIKTWDYS